MARRQRGEGGVYKRSDGLWVGSYDLGWVDGKRKRKVIYGKTQREAVTKLNKVKAEAAAGHISTGSLTVEKWARHWLETIAPTKVGPTTLPAYRTIIEQYVVPAIGKIRVDRLTAAHVRAVHAKASDDGRSSTTANHAHWVLSAVLEAAVRDGKTPRNVCNLEDAPEVAATDQRSLRADQAALVLRTARDDRLLSRWLFALLLGPRQGECLGLTWACLDFDAHHIDLDWQLRRVPYIHGCKTPCGRRGDRCPERRVEIPDRYKRRHLEGNVYLLAPKRRKSRRVVMHPFLELALLARGEAYEQEKVNYSTDHGLVWAREDGRPIDSRTDYLAWQALLQKSGLPRMPLHGARHTSASLLDELGATEATRMAILGHSQATTTMGYTHVDLTHQRIALDRMVDLLQLGSG